MAKELSLGWPDSQTVTVFLDGKHVATMTNAKGYEDGIPVELFDLMRAAPDMLAALRTAADFIGGISESLTPKAPGAAKVWRDHFGSLHESCLQAIEKAEGR